MKLTSRLLSALHAAGATAVFLALAAPQLEAKVFTWNGAGTTWNSATNWTGGGKPNGTADSIIFTGTTNLSTTNDYGAANFLDITFDANAGAFTLAGNALTINNGFVTNASANLQTISLGIASTTALALNNTSTGSTLISGVISGAAPITVNSTGTGVMTLSAANTYTGTTTISAGVLNIQNATGLGTTAAGTSVTSGAALQIQGGITVGAEALTLNGTGVTATGALRSISGTNSYAGAITLGSASQINTDAGTLTVTGGVTGAFNLTFGGAGSTTVSTGAIATGAGTLTKTGAGTLTLSSANTYTGITTISAGVLNIQNATGLGTTAGATSVAAGSALQIQGGITVGAEALTLNGTGVATDGALRNISGTNTYGGLLTLASAARINSDLGTLNLTNAGTITGATFGLSVGGAGNTSIASIIGTTSGTLTKDGTGTLTLTGANTYTGTTTISAGVLNIQTATALGTTTGATSVAAGSALQIQGGITVGAEALTLNGTGIATDGVLRNISGTNTYGGLLTLGSASRINSDAGTLNLTNVGTITGAGFGLSFGGAGNTAVTSIIGTTTGTLTKDGSGTLTLSGANTYTGLTTVTAGTLAYGVNNALASGAVTVAGGTLNMSTFTDTVGAVTLTSGSITGTGTLTGTSYALQGGTVSANLGTGTATVSTATTTLNGVLGSLVVNVNSGSLALGASDRLDNGAAVTLAGGVLDLSTFNDTVSTYAQSGGSLNGTGTLTATTYGLTGGTVAANLGAGTLNVSTGASTLNGTSGATTVNITSGSLTLGASSRLSSSADVTVSAGASLNLANYLQTLASFNGAGNVNLGAGGTGKLTTGAGTISGVISGDGSVSGGVVKTGAGTLTLSGANTFLGNVEVQNGTLSFNTLGALTSAQSLGQQGTVKLGVTGVSGGTLDYTGTGGIFNHNVTVLGNGSVIQNSGSGLLDIHGTIDPQLGSLTLAGGSSGITVSSQIAGSAANITTTGTVNLDGGFISSTAALTVNGKLGLGYVDGGVSQTVAGLAGNGSVTGVKTGAGNYSTLTINASTSNTFSGVIGGATADENNLGLTISGGTQTLSGAAANTFTGETLVQGGTLTLSKSAGVNAIGGNLHVDSGTVQLGASEQIGDSADVTIMGTGVFTFSGSGKTETIGTFHNNGGTFTTGANTLAGTGNSIYFNGGTNTISNGGSTQDAHYLITAGTNTVEAGGTLEVLSGGLGLQFGGTASPTLSLASSNGTAGRILLNGNIEVLSSLSSGSAQILSSGSGTNKGYIDLNGGSRSITVNSSGSATGLTIAAVIANGSLTKAGSGTLTLSGANTYTGTTTVNAGTLAVTGSTGSGNLSVASGATLTGNGTIGGATNVTGIIAPGIGLGTMTFVQSLTLAGAATANFELNPLNQTAGGGFNDLIRVQGDLVLDGEINVSGWDAATFTGYTAKEPLSWTLFTYTGSLTLGDNLKLGSMPELAVNHDWVLDTTNIGEVRVTVVPEPSAFLLGALGVVGVALRRRRR